MNKLLHIYNNFIEPIGTYSNDTTMYVNALQDKNLAKQKYRKEEMYIEERRSV